MTDAPEKIWATGNKTTGSWNKTAINPRIAPEQTEYARKDMLDIANARIAELEAAYCLAMLRIGVLDGILSITNPTTEEAP